MGRRSKYPYKRRSRFARFTFDAAWRAGIEVIVRLWRPQGRGTFIVSANRDGGLVATITLPDGRIYTSTLRPNHTFDQDWYLGFVTCIDPAVIPQTRLTPG